MVIRTFIKYFKRRFDWIIKNIEMTGLEQELLEELITHKNYKPRTDKQRFRSFNTVYREWLFKLRPFCDLFNIFISNKQIKCLMSTDS